jgi:methylthioribose-1-phosphate isomerase
MSKIIQWVGDAETGHLRLLDQTRLPNDEFFLDCRDVQTVWDAIRRLSVRGAPAIGVAAAYACVLSVQRIEPGSEELEQALSEAVEHLGLSRPTAVNLFWALRRMSTVRPLSAARLLAEAVAIDEENKLMTRRIGEHGLALLQGMGFFAADRPAKWDKGAAVASVLTHCNAGALACDGIGTATAPIYLAHERGLKIKVYADETRPLLQGARLTVYELRKANVDVTLICDSMAAQVMREGRVDAVIVGADRIAANGDTANKIGTYGLAVLAKHHNVPFIVAAPSTTFDMSLTDGSSIPIEHRAPEEVTAIVHARLAPRFGSVYNPAFDVTPHELIRAIVTERGVVEPVNRETVAAMLGAVTKA